MPCIGSVIFWALHLGIAGNEADTMATFSPQGVRDNRRDSPSVREHSAAGNAAPQAARDDQRDNLDPDKMHGTAIQLVSTQAIPPPRTALGASLHHGSAIFAPQACT